MQTPAGEPSMPATLDEVGVECWRRVVPQLAAAGVLAVIDRESIEGMCTAYSAAVRFGALALAEPIVETPFGPKLNPAAKESRAQWLVVKAFATEFGLTPASRTKISAPGKPKGDEAADFLFGPPELKVVK